MRLNLEQRRIIEQEPNGHMLIKGVAGSGKTTVAVRRVPFLLNHYAHEANDNILLVTYNKTLREYLRHLYEKVDTEEEYQSSFFHSKTSKVDIETIDSLMISYCVRNSENKSIDFADDQKQRDLMIKAISKISERYPAIKQVSPKNVNFLLDEIEWIKACGISDEQTYQNIDRIGRANESDGAPQLLSKNSIVRSAIYNLQLVYDRLLANVDLMTFRSMNLIALDEAQRGAKKKYTHILIDESQDLSKVQLEFLKCVYQEKKYSSITFIADNTQSIYSHSWLGKGRPYTSIGYDMTGKSRTLTKNYRTTTEISTAAYGLIECDEVIRSNVDFIKPALIDRQGSPPIYRYFRENQQQLNFLIDEIEILKNNYELSDICIVAREHQSLNSVLSYFKAHEVPCEHLSKEGQNFQTTAVKLVTMHSIKGLEFKVIFIIDLNHDVIPSRYFSSFDDPEAFDSDERKLLYVGMTRANELLYMSTVGKPSKFISEIQNEHLRIKRDCIIRPFKSIATYEYQLKEQIVDINAKEEIVRQWMIRELNKTYGYPLSLLELEYPVQQFSKKGYVDIAVIIHHQGKEIPYIFVETKRFGQGIENALIQLKSYMNADEEVRYGVVTDGMSIEIIDRDGEQLHDIPKCHPHFLPEMRRDNIYINFSNDRKYRYSYEKDSPRNIEICDFDSNLHLEFTQTAEIPILGEVAAGMPISVNVEYDEYLTVPEGWIYQRDKTFALRVTGDSMKDKEIDKGDIVLVHKQETAENGDAVVVLINGETTIKTFRSMGGAILLISENSDYEPIQMNPDDVKINGRVIGVMKNGKGMA